MPKYNGKVFTYAGGEHRGADLLFSTIPNYDANAVTAETVEEIAKDSTVHEVLGPDFVVIPTRDFIIATSTNVRPHVTGVLENPSFLYIPIAICMDSNVEIQKVTQIYSSCALPDKYILGCSHCMGISSNSEGCKLHRLARLFEDEAAGNSDDQITPQELRKTWKPTKTKIAGFTLVSPTLTSRDHITPHHREPAFHDFAYVNGNSETRSLAMKERQRIHLFENHSCTQCFVQTECWEAYHARYVIKHCPGNYTLSQTDAAKEIVKQAGIPYTDKQLTFLLANSGELEERVNRKKWWATLTYSRDGDFRFGLRRVTAPYEFNQYIFKNFDEAKQCILAHNTAIVTPEESYKLSTLEKATLAELVSHPHSPRLRSGWVGTQYPLLGVTFNPYERCFKAFYRYERGRCTLQWNVQVENLTDIYKYYGKFSMFDRGTSPYARSGGTFSNT